MSDSVFAKARGILFDLDGVVHIGDTPIEGAAQTLRYLGTKNVPFRFVTNTTTLSTKRLHKKMTDMELPIEADRIFTTHEVASNYLRSLGDPSCFLLVADNVLPAYQGLTRTDAKPQYVVIGDIGDGWNYSVLNKVFNMVMEGAEIIALHKGRFWRTESGLQMDIGAFVAGLEYVTGKTATIIGKPSPTFFEMAAKDMKLSPHEVVMIGDDLENDVGGAQRAGIPGVLVQTGKYREDTLSKSSIVPDAVIASIAELQQFV